MRLIIAEKPSLAQAIRDVLPVGGGVKVTHCYGHMLELASPATYDEKWAKWSVADLPIKVSNWKLLPKPSATKQLGVIANLIRGATEVVHAGDPDREGQLLVDEVLEYVRWRGPVQRLLINAADPESVKKALGKLENNERYKGLRHSAECRQRADWLVGMNLSRAITKLLSPDHLVSIGRVQTPTLALVVRRQLAIDHFVSEKFWTLKARFSLSGGRDVELRCEPDPRILDERQAGALVSAIKGKTGAMAVSVDTKHRLSPLPYHLGDFQKAAERHFGWGIAKSLEALQAAYEAKLTSYPRVDCRYLPSEQMAQALSIAKKVAGSARLTPEQMALMRPKKRVYDSQKVEVHHGIVPTGLLPGRDVSQEARQAWELVSAHFLRTLMPDEAYEKTELSIAMESGQPAPYQTLKFSRNAERLLNEGDNWKLVNLDAMFPPVAQRRKKTGPTDDRPIPAISDGETAHLVDGRRNPGKTTPPEPYTESSLQEDMSSVAKFVDNPKLKATLKETSGIGTSATQAGIIETLKKRGYLDIQGKTLHATDLGLEIIRCIPKELADPGITAAWEDALHHIAAGQYTPSDFMSRVDKMIERRIEQAQQLRSSGVSIKADVPKIAAKRPTKERNAGRSSSRTGQKSTKRATPASKGPDMGSFF